MTQPFVLLKERIKYNLRKLFLYCTTIMENFNDILNNEIFRSMFTLLKFDKKKSFELRKYFKIIGSNNTGV